MPLLSIGQNAELIAGMTLDLDFKTLYPTEQPDPAKELEMMTGAGLPEDFLDRWARRSTEEIAASLARIESEAALVGINDPRWSPGLCARLVKRVPDSVAIADACLRHKLPADLVGPFVISAATTKQPGWQGLVQCCLDLRSYGGLAAQVVLTQDRPPQELLTRALVAAGDFPRVINACCLRGEVPVTTLHQMFRADDPQVAVAAAIGRWCSVRQRADRDNLLDDAWRQAILRASDDGSGLSHHDQYWIREILAQDPRLAEGWLLLRFSRCSQGAVSWELEEIATGLVPRLDVRQRARVLAGLRADCGSDKLVKCLVGDDNDLYQRLLDTKELTPLHLAPLVATPSASWRSKAKLALNHGYSVDDIAHASIQRTRFIGGSMSEMWAAERLAFEALLDDPDPRLVHVGKSGVEFARERQRHAVRIERYNAVHGVG